MAGLHDRPGSDQYAYEHIRRFTANEDELRPQKTFDGKLNNPVMDGLGGGSDGGGGGAASPPSQMEGTDSGSDGPGVLLAILVLLGVIICLLYFL